MDFDNRLEPSNKKFSKKILRDEKRYSIFLKRPIIQRLNDINRIKVWQDNNIYVKGEYRRRHIALEV